MPRRPPGDNGPDTSGTMTKGDTRTMGAEMRANDRAERERYESEMRRHGIDTRTGERTRPPWYAKADQHTRAALTGSVGGTAAGLMLGALGWFVAVAYLRSGTAGVKSWLGAKFVNKPTGAPSPVPAAATPSSGTSSSSTGTASPAATGTPAATWDLLPPASTGSPAAAGQPEVVLV